MTEKRAPRSYKARQTAYVLASEKAKYVNTTLAAVIETVIVFMAAGHQVQFAKPGELRPLKTAMFDMPSVEAKLKLPKSKSVKK